MPKDTILMMKAKVVMKKAADLDVLNKVKNAEEKAVLKALNLKKKIEEKVLIDVYKKYLIILSAFIPFVSHE